MIFQLRLKYLSIDEKWQISMTSVTSKYPEAHLRLATEDTPAPVYQSSQGVDAYLQQVREATPMQMVEIERQGIAGTFITDLSKRMELPSSRVFAMLRIPPATAARKSVPGAVVDGRAGLAALGMIKLLGIAQDIVQDSTAAEAQGFDTVKWLGQWIERPQPALGGRKPADYLDTPTGVDIVARLLGAIRSGAYL
ncbi:MAG: DUF2384 domain-containing protein [Burkholderiaceae bacterium]